jgi:hypothetical protein
MTELLKYNDKKNFFIEPALIHSLFEQNLSEHYGNDIEKMLKFVIDNSSDEKFKNILIKSRNYVIEAKKMLTSNYSYGNKPNFIKKSYQEIELSVKKVFKKDNINELIEKTFKENNEFYLASGWGNSGKGHAITSYYNKIDNNSYEFLFFNSGGGLLDHHKYDNKSDKWEIMLREVLNKDQIMNLIKQLTIISYIGESDHLSFYNVIKNYFTTSSNGILKSIINDDIKDINMQRSQISGSCTYMSQLYFKLYYLYKINRNYDLYYKEEQKIEESGLSQLIKILSNGMVKTQHKNIVDIIKHKIFKKLKNDEELYKNDKNILDKISIEKKKWDNKIKDLYFRYYNDVINLTKLEHYKLKNIDDNIKLIEQQNDEEIFSKSLLDRLKLCYSIINKVLLSFSNYKENYFGNSTMDMKLYNIIIHYIPKIFNLLESIYNNDSLFDNLHKKKIRFILSIFLYLLKISSLTFLIFSINTDNNLDHGYRYVNINDSNNITYMCFLIFHKINLKYNIIPIEKKSFQNKIHLNKNKGIYVMSIINEFSSFSNFYIKNKNNDYMDILECYNSFIMEGITEKISFDVLKNKIKEKINLKKFRVKSSYKKISDLSKKKIDNEIVNYSLYLLLSISNLKIYGNKHFFYLFLLSLDKFFGIGSENDYKFYDLFYFNQDKYKNNKKINKLDEITSNFFENTLIKNSQNFIIDKYDFKYESKLNRVYHNIRLISENINNDNLNNINLYFENFTFDNISNNFIFNTKSNDKRINVKLGNNYHVNLYNGYINMKNIIDKINFENIQKNILFINKNTLLYLNYIFYFYDYIKLDNWIKITSKLLNEKLKKEDNYSKLLLLINRYLETKDNLLANSIILLNKNIVTNSKMIDMDKYNIIKLYYNLFLIKYNESGHNILINTLNYNIIETEKELILKKNNLDLNEYKLIKEEIKKNNSIFTINNNIITIKDNKYLLNITTENKTINKYIKNQLMKIETINKTGSAICTFQNSNYKGELLYTRKEIEIDIKIDNISLNLSNYNNNLIPYNEKLDLEFKENNEDIIKHKLFRYLSNDDGLIIFKDENEKENVWTLYELIGYKNNNNNLCILCKNDKDKKYFYINNKKKIEIVEDSNGMFNRWIYNLPGSFILKDKNKYSILYPNLNISNYIIPGAKKGSLGNLLNDIVDNTRLFNENTDLNCISEFWSDINFFNSLKKKKFKNTIKKEYNIVELNYNGTKLKFKNQYEIENYILLCIFYSKTDCLYSCFDEFLNFVNKNGVQNYVLKECVLKGQYNNPFNRYFDFKFKYNSKYLDNHSMISYAKIIQDNLFPSKYLIFNYNHNSNSFNRNNFKEKSIEWKLSEEFDKISEKYVKKQFLQEEMKKQIDNCNLNFKLETKDKFKDSYYKSILKTKFDKEIIMNEKNYILNDIFSNDINSDERLVDKIFKDIKNYQKLLNINLIYNFKNDINNKDVGTNIQKYYNNINPDIIYQGVKTSNIILFEILFGFYIRKEQYEIYSDIIKCINGYNKNYKVYQLLMGKGKTSVIVPLVCSYFALYKEEFKNIFLLMPSHLIKQTYDEFTQKYITLLDDSNIEKLDNIKRYKENQNLSYLDLFNDKYFEWKIHDKVYRKKTINNNVIIIDDVNIKTLLLNKVLVKDEKLKKKYSDTLDIIRDKSVIVIDEFDLLYNPLTSELNFPNVKYTIDSKENKFSIETNIYEYFINKLFELYKENGFKIIEYSEQIINKFNIKNKNNYKFQNMKETLKYCLYHIYKLHYGFPTKNSHINQYSAVPYSAVNNPVKLSNFSDPDINIILTTLTYIYDDNIRFCDLERIMFKISELKKLKKYIKKINYYSDLSKILDMKIEYLMEYPLDKENLEKLVDKFNDCKEIKIKKEFIFNYVKENILPKLTYSNKFKNCSFIDVIGSSFSKYKCGFSGTVNISLPRYQNSEKCLMYEFCSINESKVDQLSTDVGLLGCLNKTNNIYKNNNIFDLIKQYDSLIDSGAFLLEYKSIDVIKKIKKILPEKKYFIFIDQNDKKMYYDRDKDSFMEYHNQVFNQKDLFIYYDNKHIVGIDIKQPSELRGLVTVSKFNRTTDIAQASYRLRNINYGHEVDFFVSNEITYKINNKVDLLRFLNEKEKNMKDDSRHRLYLQNLKYLVRKNDINNFSNYEDIKFDKYVYSFGEYIHNIFGKKNYLEFENGQLINKIIQELKIETKLLNRNQEQEQEKQSEKEKQKNKHLQRNLYILKPENEECQIEKYEYTDYVFDDYININEDKIKKIIDNIYYTPYFNFNEYNQYNNNKRLDNEFKYYSLKKYFMNIHNFYYIKNKKNNRYLIISPVELFVIQNITRNNKIDKDIIVKNKNGLIIKELYDVQITDTINKNELFIQLLLGKELSYNEYLYLFETLLKHNKHKYIDLLNKFSDCFGVKYYNYFMIEMINNNNNLKEILNKLDSMNNNDFFTTLSGAELYNLNNSKIITKIKNQILKEINYIKDKTQSGGFNNYKLKYYKYKKKYLELKNNLK